MIEIARRVGGRATEMMGGFQVPESTVDDQYARCRD